MSDRVLLCDVIRPRSFSPWSSALHPGRFALAFCRNTNALDAAFVHCIRATTHPGLTAGHRLNGTPFAEADTIELIEHGFLEALADAVGLRALCLGPRMINVFDREIKLIPVSFRKVCLQSLIAAIEVDDGQVRTRGSKDFLEKAVLASQNGPAILVTHGHPRHIEWASCRFGSCLGSRHFVAGQHLARWANRVLWNCSKCYWSGHHIGLRSKPRSRPW